MFKTFFAVFALSAISLLSPAYGAPISFTFEADVAGTVDAQPFSSHIRFDFFSDTLAASTFSNSTTNGYRTFVFQEQSTVTIDGIGTGNLLTRHFLIANPNAYCECVSIQATADSSDLFGIWQTGLNLSNPYDFTTAVGPVSGGQLQLWGTPMETSLGTLDIFGYTGTAGNAMFSATLVPIPAAAWLFGSAVAGLGWMQKKQSA